MSSLSEHSFSVDTCYSTHHSKNTQSVALLHPRTEPGASDCPMHLTPLFTELACNESFHVGNRPVCSCALKSCSSKSKHIKKKCVFFHGDEDTE